MLASFRFFIAAVLLTICVFGIGVQARGRGQAAAHPDWARVRWKAQWIACPEAPQRDAAVFHFRKTFELADPPKEFVVHVSADNRFILFVNGARVGEGPAASDLGHWKYETFDLSAFLHSGKNIIGATVWNFGTQAPVAQMTSRAGFVLQGEGAAQQIANTDDSWQVEIENGHGISPTDFMSVLQDYYAGPPGEIIDGRRYDWNWNNATARSERDGTQWKKAMLLGEGAARESQDTRTIWMLQPNPLPQMEYREVPAGRVAASSGVDSKDLQGTTFHVAAHAQATVLLDAGALTTAYPELILSGGSDARVRLTYAEALVDDQGHKGNRNETQGRHILGVYDEFIADGGKHRSFTPLIWRTWRYLQMDVTTGPQALDVAKLRVWFTAYPFREEARFNSNDPELSKIWEVGWRTARLCAHETYMDTPYYERLQYVGDTRIQALISYVVSGDDRLARQAINAIDYSRIPDGITTSRYPSQLPQFIPTFSLMWIGMVHDFFMYRDDPEFVRKHLAGTRTVLDWFLQRQRADGLLDRLPWWPFVDWAHDFVGGVPPQDADGGSAPITLQFIEALRDAAELEEKLGDAGRAKLYTERAEKAAGAVRKLCWDEKTGLIADTPARSHFSQHANALAAWLDVIPAAQQKAVMAKVVAASSSGAKGEPTMSEASYYFRFYLARAMEHAGMADSYLSMLRPWRDMLKMGLTTWAETPEPTRSDSHAWSAHPNFDLLLLVAGIGPGAAGFSEIVIKPHPGNLRTLSATMPHPKGRIELSYNVESSGATAKISVPEGVPAHVIWKGRSYNLHSGEQKLQLP
jgi:alpha-L-rhamnosidase